MKESILTENFEKQISAYASRDKAKDRMMESMASIMSFSDDQQTGAKYAKILFSAADAVDDYVKLQMQLVAYLKELSTLIKENAQEATQTGEAS